MNVDGIEVNFFPLDVEPVRLSELRAILSEEELSRAARFHFDKHRNRYIACRGTLRELLGMKPDQCFAYGPYGKPLLDGAFFNVSHSHEMGMIAIADREVGCDIERIDPSFADDKIPERFFSPYEVAALRALPAADQCDAFFRCWTRKEAYIKARGMGVYLPLDSFDVTLGEDAALVRGGDGWSLCEVKAPEGYRAAISFSKSRMSSIMKSGGAPANVSG